MTTMQEWLKTLPLEDRIAGVAAGNVLEMAYLAGAADSALTEVQRLAQELADEAARSDMLDCMTEFAAFHDWYVTEDLDPEDEQWVARAVRYLELRGLLIRHPERPHLVRLELTDAVEAS